MKFESLSVLTLSIGVLLFGMFLKKRFLILEKFCIPAPVIGGFLVSIILYFLTFIEIQVDFDTSLQTPLMVAFFTIIGLSGSFKLLKVGGKMLLIYLGCCWFMALMQNFIGISMMSLFDLNKLYGILCGAVSLEGGHGNAIAFGGMVEELGNLNNAKVLALAAATFGLIFGSLLGGPVARYLINRHHLKITTNQDIKDTDPLKHEIHIASYKDFLKSLFLILCLMCIGFYLSSYFTQLSGYSLPSYVGAMLIAIIVRNINDIFNFFNINQYTMDTISELSLGIFLTMAMMSLKINQLSAVATPLFITLLVQILALLFFAVFIVFRLCGKNYDSAIMCAGLMGHGLGATPNAVANMSAACARYGLVSKQAFLIVPLCGAVLIDIVAIPLNTYLINLFA
ncbi:sodium/glutamate symporter [Campylobacter hepaticus]|uniref:Sodium/glutamate symporter n=1 Tax=Campylobacter hepaticus TaxID=1813019 RepID=A0A424Z0J4_9BACT|nr:sodium/glutamate symporter [Campylobacter hepaticus]AXP08864.1 sodium/glutamate symporter [Campylobacter hepaticus]MCZ0771850.1 sodium/glutamate symporter [Campylobacter hepaticus]MCZ0773283.1 sodium/glutamate symporter [Campylobacter hepaticus]MCZ0774534.1 sodium/glutamate symporter [Campylobacter hepaticus]MDX2323848.1 sodium/glutamate symporter [Campylobacter hepaticus]